MRQSVAAEGRRTVSPDPLIVIPSEARLLRSGRFRGAAFQPARSLRPGWFRGTRNLLFALFQISNFESETSSLRR
jgi:hypothetical protein